MYRRGQDHVRLEGVARDHARRRRGKTTGKLHRKSPPPREKKNNYHRQDDHRYTGAMKRRLSEASSSTTKRHATGLGRIQGEDFGQRTPPIHEIIRNILQEYPSGQIFKVNTDNFPASSAACSIYERSYSHNITDERLGQLAWDWLTARPSKVEQL